MVLTTYALVRRRRLPARRRRHRRPPARSDRRLARRSTRSGAVARRRRRVELGSVLDPRCLRRQPASAAAPRTGAGEAGPRPRVREGLTMAWWNFRRRRRAIVCQQAVELVTDYLEGALSRGDRARLEAHLGACPHCTEYFAQLGATIHLLGRIEPATLAPEMK